MQEGCFFCDELRRGYVPNPKGGTATDSWLPHEPGGPDCMDHLAEWESDPRGPRTNTKWLPEDCRREIIKAVPPEPFTFTELFDATAGTLPELDENVMRKYVRNLLRHNVIRVIKRTRKNPNGGSAARMYCRGMNYGRRLAKAMGEA